MRTFYSAESVTEGHPDKLCDLIADNVLDACLAGDPASRVACEVMATRGHIIVAGEITTEANPDVFNIARDVLHSVGYDPKSFQIDCYLHPQSPDIAGAVKHRCQHDRSPCTNAVKLGHSDHAENKLNPNGSIDGEYECAVMSWAT